MVNLIFKYFDKLTPAQQNQFAQLESIYKYWNQQINVISRKDIDNLYLHHVLHSLAIAKFVKFKGELKIMDYGTGGGFPGVPLAIMYPNIRFDLVDSVGKKLIVASAVAKELGLNNVKTIHTRAENISENYNFVVSRAVATPDVLWANVGSKLKKNGSDGPTSALLNLRGDDEIPILPNDVSIKKWQISQIFKEEYFKSKTLVLLSKSITINSNGKSKAAI